MFDVYVSLPGFNKSRLIAKNICATRIGLAMSADIDRQMSEGKRLGGVGGDYAQWHVEVHDSESGRKRRESASVIEDVLYS